MDFKLNNDLHVYQYKEDETEDENINKDKMYILSDNNRENSALEDKEIIKYLDNESKIEQFDNSFEDYKREIKFSRNDIPNESQMFKHEIQRIESDSSDNSRFILDLLRRDMRKNKVTTWLRYNNYINVNWLKY